MKKNKIVTFGEIMLRLATPHYERFSQATQLNASFGGGEANVAASLAHFIMELKKYVVGTKNILRAGHRMGIYFLETGAVARPSKVVYDRAGSSIAEAKADMFDWEKILDGAAWFHWTGITPALSQSAADICLQAVKTANQMGVAVSCDLNYRKNLWA